MTDEQLLDRIIEMLEYDPHRDDIHWFIREHRATGWRRRFTDSTQT